MDQYPYWLPHNRFVQYQALRGQEETLRKEAMVKLEAADKLGELAMNILAEYDKPDCTNH